MFCIGDCIDQHIIEKKIGKPSGFGNLFIVKNQQTSSHSVLKQNKDNATEDELIRFKNENEMLRECNHPNIIKSLSETISNDTGYHYFMELADNDLEDLVVLGNDMTFEGKLDFFKKVCLAVKHFHEKKIVHRDLYWSNILIRRHDEINEPKITDFGRGKSFNLEFKSTTPGWDWGANYVRPPESYFLFYEEDKINEYYQSDVYALGIIAFSLFVEIPLLYNSTIEKELRKFFLKNGNMLDIDIAERKKSYLEWVSGINPEYFKNTLLIDLGNKEQTEKVKKIVFTCIEWNMNLRPWCIDDILDIIGSN